MPLHCGAILQADPRSSRSALVPSRRLSPLFGWPNEVGERNPPARAILLVESSVGLLAQLLPQLGGRNRQESCFRACAFERPLAEASLFPVSEQPLGRPRVREWAVEQVGEDPFAGRGDPPGPCERGAASG